MLHDATRRYLIDRADELTGNHRERSIGAPGALARHRLVVDLLHQVERLDPDDLPDPGTLTGLLLEAAGVPGPAAVLEERERYRSAVLAGPDPRTVPPGYRRLLSADEASAWRATLRSRWGVENDLWHPMLAIPEPPEVLILTDTAMTRPDGVEAVRRAVRATGWQRVAELREDGTGHLLDVDLFTPHYNGAEGLWCDAGLDWIAYASHEGTVAFGGILATAVPANWPDVERWRWHGWQ